jgi:hypothetical protein
MTIRFFFFLLFFLTVSIHAADLPQPPLLPDETRTNMEMQIIRQFAPPITVGDGSALLFQADGSKTWLRRIFPAQPERNGQTVLPISIETWPRIGYSEKETAQYASITTRSGTWLVGPSIHLIRPDGRISPAN